MMEIDRFPAMSCHVLIISVLHNIEEVILYDFN